MSSTEEIPNRAAKDKKDPEPVEEEGDEEEDEYVVEKIIGHKVQKVCGCIFENTMGLGD